MAEPFHELSSAERLRILKEALQKGFADIEAGRVHEWDFDEFLRRARVPKLDEN
jgi:hypothetical protein